MDVSRKALAKTFIYFLLFGFFIIYTFYFSRFVQFPFATTPIVFSQNQSPPASPATFSATQNKSFSIRIVPTGEPVDQDNVYFIIGRNITNIITTLGRCANGGQVACTWNDSVEVFRINFTAETFDEAGKRRGSGRVCHRLRFVNDTNTIQYTLDKANPSLSCSGN